MFCSDPKLWWWVGPTEADIFGFGRKKPVWLPVVYFYSSGHCRQWRWVRGLTWSFHLHSWINLSHWNHCTFLPIIVHFKWPKSPHSFIYFENYPHSHYSNDFEAIVRVRMQLGWRQAQAFMPHAFNLHENVIQDGLIRVRAGMGQTWASLKLHLSSGWATWCLGWYSVKSILTPPKLCFCECFQFFNRSGLTDCLFAFK